MSHKRISDINYSVPLNNPDKKDNESYIYRSPECFDLDLKNYKAEFETLHDCYRQGFESKPDSNCIGVRLLNEDGSLQNVFSWYSKRYVREMAEWIGSGFVALNLSQVNNEWEGNELNMVAVYSKNSFNYILMDLGMTMQGIASVPIYDTLGEDAAEFILNQTKVLSCFLTVSHVKNMIEGRQKFERYSHLKNLIVLDPENLKDELGTLASSHFNLYTIDDLIAEGKKKNLPWAKISPDTVYCLSYTSGTTGNPKGAVITHRSFISMFSGVAKRVKFNINDVHLSYLPFAHVMERAVFNYFIAFSVKIGIFNGDVQKLKEDLGILRPTIFISVPRLYNKFYELIKNKINETKGFKKKMVDKAISTKLQNLAKYGQLNHFLYDMLIFKKMKQIFGGRVRIMLTASAPISLEVINFMKICFCCPVVEAYGQTEGSGAEFTTYLDDNVSGHVGGPLHQNEFKLVDIPEMNYTHKDVDDNGRSRPRGEIWVRGPNVVPGYFLNPEETANGFTEDGWLMSGDVGQLLPNGNRMQIIDRKKNIFKLSQGEYIAPEKLEGAYVLVNSLFNDIFVYGDSFKSSLVAILNIDTINMKLLAKQQGFDPETPDLAKDEKFLKALIYIINKEAEKRKYNRLECIRKIHVESRLFVDLSLLTVTLKKKRNDFKLFYLKEIDEMYMNLD